MKAAHTTPTHGISLPGASQVPARRCGGGPCSRGGDGDGIAAGQVRLETDESRSLLLGKFARDPSFTPAAMQISIRM